MSMDVAELVTLDVVRDVYCDKEVVERALGHICGQGEDLLGELVEIEKRPYPECRSPVAFNRCCYKISEFLRDSVSEDVGISPARLALLDCMYEITRSVRSTLELVRIPVVGQPLAESPEGPFPALIDKPVERDENGQPRWVSQELADKFCALAYETHPEILYEVCEGRRRQVTTHEIGNAFDEVSRVIEGENDLGKKIGCLSELGFRLDVMCKIPSQEQIKSMMEAEP